MAVGRRSFPHWKLFFQALRCAPSGEGLLHHSALASNGHSLPALFFYNARVVAGGAREGTLQVEQLEDE
jgi:hypothetical protein